MQYGASVESVVCHRNDLTFGLAQVRLAKDVTECFVCFQDRRRFRHDRVQVGDKAVILLARLQ